MLLINRVLGWGFNGGGVELIASLRDGDDAPEMMLISNYADAQQAAVEAGALPGFGKSELHTVGVKRLRDVLAGDA